MRNRDLSRISEKLPINRSILSSISGKSRFYRQKCGDFEDMGRTSVTFTALLVTITVTSVIVTVLSIPTLTPIYELHSHL